MAKQTINIGSGELTGDGESLRSAFDKINDNFDEVYTGSGTTLGSDTTPSLGGNLDLSGNDITGIGNLNITGNITATGSISASLAYSNLTNTPTTLAGYGITDAYTQTQVDTAITNATSNLVIQSGSTQSIDIVASDSTVLVDSVNGTLNATTLTGALPAINGSALTNITTTFANITSTPTTLAGYGITDATSSNSPAFTGIPDFTGSTIVDMKNTAVDFTGSTITGTNFLTTVAFADLTSKPTTLAGYGITDAASTGNTTFTGTIQFNETVKFEQGVTEAFGTYNNVSGVTVMDLDHGHLFYVTNATGDLTTNFTNLDMAAEYGTNITVIINQGATPYEVTAVQIGGAAQTINWQGGSQPTGNANGIDAFSFTILNDGGTYVVLGQMVDFT